MGVSKGEGGGVIAGERGLGTIVWVRRRNGSWWPGRILGQEELSASHLMSPRSGTPVKLLGREDASVDWYNLEKSKRVKAFRCGEFDACIERAEASQGIPIKKREKYARREDAILHAIELEKQMLGRKQQKFGTSSSKKLLATSRNEQNVGFPSGSHAKNNGSSDHVRFVSKSQHISRKVSSSSEASTVNPLYAQKGKGGKYSTFADDTSETTPRMRELLDYNLRSTQSKRKSAATASSNRIQRPFPVDSHGYGIPGPVQHIEMGRKIGLCVKKRRIQGGFDEEYIGKKRDSCRPLVQGLQSSAKLPTSQSSPRACVSMSIHMKEEIDQNLNISKDEICAEDNLPDHSYDCLDHRGYSSDQIQTSPNLLGYPGGASAHENTSSGLKESNSTGGDESDDDTDTEDDETLFAGIGQSFTPLSRKSGRSVEDGTLIAYADQERYRNLDGKVESLSSGYMYPHYPHEKTTDTSADLGVSKWNLKGKHSIRNITRRPTEDMDEMVGGTYHGSMNGRSYDGKRRALKSSRVRPIGGGFYQKYGDLNENENDFIKKYLVHPTSRYGNHRYSPLFKGTSGDHRGDGMYDFDEDSSGTSPSVWEGEGVPRVTRQGYWETEGDLGSGMEAMLVDVDLKVQASYLGERVPLVSLMSRLNGKSIIGHVVQIETLNEGSTKSLISRNESDDDLALDENETPPVWRTAKRTSMQCVPRLHPLPAALEGKEADSLLYSEPTFKKSSALHFDQAKLANKTSHNHKPVMPAKLQKKALKNISLSNQKAQKLSSIATEQKACMGDGILDGLVKPVGSVPVVSRVPVKVVFSRILEAVGRSSSTSVTHRNPIPGPSPKEPS